MKNFKEMLDKDLDSTFYNLKEFAQLRRIRYNGFDKKIPVIFDNKESGGRRQLASGDNAEGIYKRNVILRVQLADLGKEPERDTRFWIGNEMFIITSVFNEYNELIIGLERFDG